MNAPVIIFPKVKLENHDAGAAAPTAEPRTALTAPQARFLSFVDGLIECQKRKAIVGTPEHSEFLHKVGRSAVTAGDPLNINAMDPLDAWRNPTRDLDKEEEIERGDLIETDGDE